MYRKRKQLMELAVCGIDALAVIFSLFVAGMIRYQSLRELMWRENPQELCSMMLVLHIAAFYFLKVYNGFFRSCLLYTSIKNGEKMQWIKMQL